MREYYKTVDGVRTKMTEDEARKLEADADQQERDYWQTISYEDAVNREIRKRYSDSAEFAILRQKDEKPEEYAEYFAYCEECKALVKRKKAEVSANES